MAKTCFVVQGFGKKTDFQSGRVLDLDASYEVIKDAVKGAGLDCIRADEIPHSGPIDKPMYEQILNADLVIADLSTSNVNAAYELGVRHALRPQATIIIAESKFSSPFDVNHIVIRTYEHLGSDIGRREAQRFSDELKKAITEILKGQQTDSPVYTFLPRLHPPREQAQDVRAVLQAAAIPQENEQSVKMLMDQAKLAMKRSTPTDLMMACGLLKTLRELRPQDSYIVQQLVLATYKSQLPTPEAALLEAKKLLESLEPQTCHDTETLGLWGAIHKRLWELKGQRSDLDEAVFAYEKGFHLRHDYYNGINLAYLLNVRAAVAEPADAITDFVLARRVRRQILAIGESLLATGPETDEAKYWILATLWEAAVGIDDEPQAQKWQQQAVAVAPAPWMLNTTKDQIEKLQKLLAQSPLQRIDGSAS